MEADAAICPSCDHILDTSFLEEAGADLDDDEGTDPRGEVPPGLDDEGTDPGAAPAATFGDEGTDPGGAPDAAAMLDEGTDPGAMMPTMVGEDDGPEDATQVGPAPGPRAGGGEPDDLEDDPDAQMQTLAGTPDELGSATAPPARAPKREMPEAPPPQRAAPRPEPAPPAPKPAPPSPRAAPAPPAAPPAPRPVPAAPPSRPGSAASSAPRSRSAPGTGSAPGFTSSSGSATGDGSKQRPSLREQLDFDTSSELMDDYDKVFRDLWRRFVAAPVAEKIVASGAVLALISVLMPWRVVLSDTGGPEERIGLAVGGWLTLLLAGGCLALSWLRLTRQDANQMHFVLGQLGAAALGLIWAGIGLLGGLLAASSAPEHVPVMPGPAYGVFVCGLAWSISLVGALLGLKDLAAGAPRRR